MKIVHVYAQNLEMFENALDGTGCHINGSRHLAYMMKSLTIYNSRDVMGLIVFANPMTKKTLKLIQSFDSLNIFSPLPIVLICDNAEELYKAGKIRVKNSQLFVVNSFENTISDIDLQRIFATLSCLSGEMYDLSAVEYAKPGESSKQANVVGREKGALAQEVLSECARLGGIGTHANKRKEPQRGGQKAKGKVGKSAGGY